MKDELGGQYPLTRDERSEHHKLLSAVKSGGGDEARDELQRFEERMHQKYALDLTD